MSAAVNPEEFNGNLPGPVAGIDIGGTKIATLIVDADGAVLGRATHASSVGDRGGAVASIAACLDEALGRAASEGTPHGGRRRRPWARGSRSAAT